MKRRPYTIPFIVMTIATLLVTGCVSNPWDDFHAVPYAQGEPTKEESYADLITLVSDDSSLPMVPDEALVEEPTPHEIWLEQKATWEEVQNRLAEIDPTYEPQEFLTPDPDLVVEETEIIEEIVEETIEAPVVADEAPVKEPNMHIDSPLEAFTKEDRARSVNVADTEVPDWFIWICSVLILATLITLCYIAKQRKEAQWYRRRGD